MESLGLVALHSLPPLPAERARVSVNTARSYVQVIRPILKNGLANFFEYPTTSIHSFAAAASTNTSLHSDSCIWNVAFLPLHHRNKAKLGRWIPSVGYGICSPQPRSTRVCMSPLASSVLSPGSPTCIQHALLVSSVFPGSESCQGLTKATSGTATC